MTRSSSNLWRRVLWTAALMATRLSGNAGAEDRVSPELVLSPAEMREAAQSQSFLDGSTSILSIRSLPVDRAEMAPVPKFSDRVNLAAQQLASDLAYHLTPSFAAPASTAASPSGNSTQRIIGSDDRTKVTNTQTTPFKAICYIEMQFSGGNKIATAEFVHPRVLLSNAHCVYSSSLGGWAKKIRVVPGKNGSQEAYGSQYSTTYYAPTEWVSGGKEGNRDYDISWIILPDKTLFNRMGYTFGYQTTSDSTLASSKLNMSGYPGDKNGQQWNQYAGGNQVVYPSQYKHYLDTTGGSSGSPMWLYFSDGQRRIVGVNCAESTGSTAYNIATRMTSRYFDQTQSFNKQYP